MANINSAIASIKAMTTKTKGKISSMDANKLLAIVGLISALAVGIGFITTLFSVALGWRINNEQRVEIATSNREAKGAGERAANALKDAGIANEAAGKANERAGKLENENLALRGQVVALETAANEARTRLIEQQGRTANLEKAAADAKAAQQRTEIALATQQERAADAERTLAEVKERISDRRLVAGFRDIRKIDNANIWWAVVWYKEGDNEAYRFAVAITNAMRSAGWAIHDEPRPIAKDDTNDPVMAYSVPGVRPGITLITSPEITDRERRLKTLAEDFITAGFTPYVASIPDRPYMWVIVGSKF